MEIKHHQSTIVHILRAVMTLVLVLCYFITNITTQVYAADQPGKCPENVLTSNFSGSTNPKSGHSSGKRPIIYVHGWTGGPLKDTAIAVGNQVPFGTTSAYIFDYSKWSSYWASNPNIAACLAEYVNTVSDEYHNSGGDGKTILVAHSMGGLAIRYAMGDKTHGGQYVVNPIKSSSAPYVITINTPYQGSPFAGQNIESMGARLKETTRFFANLPQNPADSGSYCLGTHHGAEALPYGCGNAAPYLPNGVKLTQIAGDITYNRRFFGHTVYEIPLSSDGIVPNFSQLGYLNSGPKDKAPSGEVEVYSKYDSCSADSGALSVLENLSFTDLAALDYFTLHDLQNKKMPSKKVEAYYLASLSAKCSHINVTTDQVAVDIVAKTINEALDDLQKDKSPASYYLVPIPAYEDQNVEISGSYVQVTGTKNAPTINKVLKEIVINDELDAIDRFVKIYGKCKTPINDNKQCQYWARPSEGTVTVNKDVVSVLIPVNSSWNRGINNLNWVSASINVDTGSPITLTDVFSDESDSLSLIAQLVKKSVLATNQCARDSYADELSRSFIDKDISSTGLKDNHYAFSSNGISIGIVQGELGASACGGPMVTIPWSDLQSAISTEGKNLIQKL